MPKENTKQRIFTRRAVIFGGLQVAAFTALAGRLGYLQFIKADEYATLSENNRIKLQLVMPERGNILDRFGVPMAINEKNYRLFIDGSGQTRQSFQATLDQLQALLPLPEKTQKRLAHIKSPPSMPEMLKEHLSWEEVSLIELHRLSLPGVYVDTGQIRHYPFNDKAAHLLGYVGTVSQEDMAADEDQSLLRQPDFKIGKTGIEKMLEDELRGRAGIRQVEVNVHGAPVREISKQDSIPGQPATITIDSRLQDFTAERVKNESASVIVLEVATGNILALVSMPGFDPDSFSTGITNDAWKQLSGNKKNPLLNKSIAGLYPPGSTFKMMVGLAGLQAGTITPETSVFCPGFFTLGDHTFNCWKAGGHGTVHYHEAIEQSCDTFFYTAAERLGIERYAQMARRFGLGELHDLGMIGEKPGTIPDPDWKWSHYKQRWAGGDTINCAIGQGYVLATPLQLAVMTARIASGNAVEPRLSIQEGEQNIQFPPLGINGNLLDLTREAMASVVNTSSGTAYAHRIEEPRFAFAGKTGTSQVKKLLARGINQETLPWEFRHHALFVGFAPLDVPKYAVAVVVEHGGGGASSAAPVARDVLLKIQQLDAG